MLAAVFAGVGKAEEREVTISGREIVERLAQLQEGQRGLEQRLAEGFAALGQRISDTNQRIDDVQASLGQRMDDTNRRIDELRQFLFWGFGVTIAGMFAVVGFVIWDRRFRLSTFMDTETANARIEQTKIISRMLIALIHGIESKPNLSRYDRQLSTVNCKLSYSVNRKPSTVNRQLISPRPLALKPIEGGR